MAKRIRTAPHPTAERLIETVVAQMEVDWRDKIHIQQVLDTSGVSKGSLYHHFYDFDALLDAAMIRSYGRGVDDNIKQIRQILDEVTSSDEFFAGVHVITLQTQSPERRGARARRLAALARAQESEGFRLKLGAEQTRLTAALAEAISAAQAKGWVTKNADAEAIAVLVQSYTLGQVFDDVSTDQMNTGAWQSLITQLLDCLRP